MMVWGSVFFRISVGLFVWVSLFEFNLLGGVRGFMLGFIVMVCEV